jgi:hypothetical protein
MAAMESVIASWKIALFMVTAILSGVLWNYSVRLIDSWRLVYVVALF